MANEFSIIDKYFKPLGEAIASPNVVMGIGDDCALLNSPANTQLAVSCDTLVAGVHFLDNADPYDIGYKALAVNLSDLAAMGATPAWFTLCVSLPEQNESWIQGFVNGMAALAKAHQIPLVGGDTTKGPLTISIQIAGTVPDGEAIGRNGAKPGDHIYVAGELGWPCLGLQALKESNVPYSDATIEQAKQALLRPLPQVELGIALRGIATSMLDISDGLTADLGHILNASGVGAVLSLPSIPKASFLQQESQQAQWDAINFGDEYKLLFTVPADRLDALTPLQTSYSLTPVGQITDTKTLVDEQGESIRAKGFQHF